MAGMFDKDKNRPADGPGTVVGTNVKLTGVLKDASDITVHGRVEGEVISERNVIVSETAEVKGPIAAQNVTVAGKVNGSISASDKLEILPTGQVFGSISTADLIVRSGAVFVGKSTMPDKSQQGEKADRPKPKRGEAEPAMDLAIEGDDEA